MQSSRDIRENANVEVFDDLKKNASQKWNGSSSKFACLCRCAKTKGVVCRSRSEAETLPKR